VTVHLLSGGKILKPTPDWSTEQPMGMRKLRKRTESPDTTAVADWLSDVMESVEPRSEADITITCFEPVPSA